MLLYFNIKETHS